MVIKLLFSMCIVGCFNLNEFARSQEPQCDPDGFQPTSPEILDLMHDLTNPCMCSSPCTQKKAAEFVRFDYIKRGLDDYQQLDVTNPFASPLFNYRKSVKFLIHGYDANGKSGWSPPTGRQLVQESCGYAILVDYRAISNCTYIQTVAEIIPSVANYVTNIILNFNLNPRKIELIGHSIGGHIAGYIGANLNSDIERITGLDPAAQGFDEFYTGLNKTCARFVQVLHTDAGDLGTAFPRGDVDFYANNRSEFQPGCSFKPCGHQKAVQYYFASLFPQAKFIGTRCGQIYDVNSIDTSRFGEFNDGQFGQFCFDTTICFPYATPKVQFENDNCSKSTRIRRRCNDCKSKSNENCRDSCIPTKKFV